MKNRNRIFALLLSIMMVFTYMPAFAFAEDEEPAETDTYATEQTDGSVDADIPAAKQTDSTEASTYTDSEDDSITEEESAINSSPKETLLGEGSEAEVIDYSRFETDDSKFAETIRNAMVNREESVTLYLRSSSEVSNDQIDNWIESALSETSSPIEGDYIRQTLGGHGIGVESSYDGDSFYNTVTINLTYFTTREQEQELTAELNKVMAGFNFTNSTSDYKKIETIYNYICDNITYDFDNLDNDDYFLKHSAYAALINKTAVCQGYATLLYRMLKEEGIDSRIICGTSHGENHAWNIVRLNGLYYCLDSTWDAGYDWYGYFLKGSAYFYNDHESDSEYLKEDFVASYPISETDYVSPEDRIIESGDFTYQTNNGKAVLLKYSGNSSDITVPSSVDGVKVVAIGSNAFSNCESLERLTLSEGIKSLGIESIIECRNLKELDFPSTLYIPLESLSGAISGITCLPSMCDNLATIKVASGSKYLTVVDGVLFDKALTSVLYYPPAKKDAEYTIPDGIEIIGSSSFAGNEYLTKVSMPDSVTFIGYWAFCGDVKLETINISKKCSLIGQYAFDQIAVERLDLPATLESIAPDGSRYPQLKEWVVDKDNNNFSANQGVLFDKKQETLLHIPDAKEGEYVIPDTVTSIMEGATRYNNLSKITIPASASIGSNNFFEHREDLVICGYDESHAQEYAEKHNITFSSLGKFETVEVASGTCGNSMTWSFDNKGVLRIRGTGTMSWEGMESPWDNYRNQINKVIVENGPEDIKDNAFNNYTALSSVTISGTVKKIGLSAFISCNGLSEVNFAEGVEEIGESAFHHCGIVNLSLPSSLTHIGEDAFSWCPTETIKVHPDNKYFTCKNNVLFSKDGKKLVLYPSSGEVESYRVPDGVETIGSYAFAYTYIKGLYCPDSLRTIENNAFSESTIWHAYLGEGISEIGTYAFFNTPIQSIAVGKKLNTVKEAAFLNASLKKVFYKGNEADWKSVVIEPYNQEILFADFKYVGDEGFCNNNVHSLVLVKPYKDPTETEDGNIEYYKCTKCGKLITINYWEGSYIEITEAETILPAIGIYDPGQEDPDDQQGSGQNTDTQTPGDQQGSIQQSSGQNTDAQTPSGQQSSGQNTDTQTPSGQQSGSQTSSSQLPAAQTPSSQQPAAQTPSGHQPAAQTPSSQQPAAQTPSSQQGGGQKPDAQTPSGQKPAAQTPASEAPTGTPEVTLSATDFTYKFAVKKVKVGKKKKKQAVATVQVPSVVSVKLNGKALTAADYDVTYSNAESSALGQYKVTVTLKGKYKGTGTATYNINPKPAKISKPAKGKKKMTVKWKKAAKNDITYKALDGYEIQYSLSSDFSSADTRTTTASKKAKSKAIKKLQSKQTYYVRIRTYKNAAGGKVYSGWSAVKAVAVK